MFVVYTVHHHHQSMVCRHLTFLLNAMDFLNEITLLTGKLLLLEDFNIHVDNPVDQRPSPHVICGCQSIQHVQSTKHKFGHTLDLVISHPDDSLVIECNVFDNLYSDLHVIKCTINHAKPNQTITSNSRNYMICTMYMIDNCLDQVSRYI